MSEQPLFQNTDEQEAAYASQALPQDSAGGTGTADNASVSAALGSGSGRLGPEPSAITTST